VRRKVNRDATTVEDANSALSMHDVSRLITTQTSKEKEKYASLADILFYFIDVI
jgi:hypothetical protein